MKLLGNYWPVVIDLETSGVDFNKHAILEVAAIPLEYSKSDGWFHSELFHEHIDPFNGAQFDPQAMAIHGIDIDHPFRHAISELEWLSSWKDMLSDVAKKYGVQRCMLVGHNAHFDLNFIMASVKRVGVKIPLHSFTCFDTATLGSYLYSETVLPKILRRAGIAYNSEKAHSAIYDTRITADLMVKILNSR